jgi:hypothetical protein
MNKQFAYHCTNINPDLILKHGFKAGKGGYTLRNGVDYLDKEFLPRNPMYLSDLNAKVWDPNAKYCLKIDITNLDLYPDFGHLMDYNPSHDEEGLFWGDQSIEDLRFLAKKDKYAKNLLNYLENETEEYNILARFYTGELSRKILGTFVIDGNLLTKNRIIDIKAN